MFKVGDKVLLRKDSLYYGDDGTMQLPPDKVGVIYKVSDISDSIILPYEVEWEHGGEIYQNSYNREDLHSRVKRTRLAKKMFPKSKESDCGKYLYIEE